MPKNCLLHTSMPFTFFRVRHHDDLPSNSTEIETEISLTAFAEAAKQKPRKNKFLLRHHHLSFMDVKLTRIFGRSRTQQFLSELEEQVDWKPIEPLLLESYPVSPFSYPSPALVPIPYAGWLFQGDR